MNIKIKFIFSILILSISMTCGCEKIEVKKEVIAYAKNENESYVIFVKGKEVFIEDSKNNIKNFRYNGKVQKVIELEKIEEKDLENNVIDNLKQISPNTYESDLKLSSSIFNNYLKDGYYISEEYATSEYLDMKLMKKEDSIRLIVYKNKIKIFLKFQEKINTPKAYINDKGEY